MVVGPSRPGLDDVLFVPDEQQGPVAALRQGLPHVRAPRVALLAADLPFLRARHIRALLEAVTETGAVLVDEQGREQWLTGCWRTAALNDALTQYTGKSLHGLLGPLRPRLVTITAEPGESPPWLDCDTPDDIERARRLASGDDVPG
jgi:molybdopterin-guanine dinucleotide biosynthesis protein A